VGAAYTLTMAACVTCLIPGEGLAVGDLAQCFACIAGLPSTAWGLQAAINSCKEAGRVRDAQRHQESLDKLHRKVNEVSGRLGL